MSRHPYRSQISVPAAGLSAGPRWGTVGLPAGPSRPQVGHRRPAGRPQVGNRGGAPPVPEGLPRAGYREGHNSGCRVAHMRTDCLMRARLSADVCHPATNIE